MPGHAFNRSWVGEFLVGALLEVLHFYALLMGDVVEGVLVTAFGFNHVLGSFVFRSVARNFGCFESYGFAGVSRHSARFDQFIPQFLLHELHCNGLFARCVVEDMRSILHAKLIVEAWLHRGVARDADRFELERLPGHAFNRSRVSEFLVGALLEVLHFYALLMGDVVEGVLVTAFGFNHVLGSFVFRSVARNFDSR